MYKELLEKAQLLPGDFIRAYKTQYTIGGVFCAFIQPAMTSPAYYDAKLIKLTAESLSYYPESSSDKKYRVLLGIYVYVWRSYDSNLQTLLNKPLVGLLQTHLGINSLNELDKELISQSYKELNIFCNWVFSNKECRQLNKLYNAFPNGMQAHIAAQLQTEPVPDVSCECNVSGLLAHFGIGKIF